jgi:protoporphyrinogen oxidase
MCASFAWKGRFFDRFYHVLLPRDLETLEFFRTLKLERSIYWRSVRSGYFIDGRMRSLSSASDFVRFPRLNPLEKIRLGAGTISARLVRGADGPDRRDAESWLIRRFGKTVYRKIWRPLLEGKFGRDAGQMSASFIWASLNRLAGNRTTSGRERMGYWRGGCAALAEAAARELPAWGVRARTGLAVSRIRPREGKKGFDLETAAGWMGFDAVVAAVPLTSLTEIIEPGILAPAFRNRLSRLFDLGIINVPLLLKHRLSADYVINILDSGFPFTGIIETSNVISDADRAGLHIVHLPRYVTPADPFAALDDAAVIKGSIQGLRRIFPGLGDDDILQAVVFREKRVQPLHGPGFRDQEGFPRMPVPGLVLAASPHLRNMNADIGEGRRAVETLVGKGY